MFTKVEFDLLFAGFVEVGVETIGDAMVENLIEVKAE